MENNNGLEANGVFNHNDVLEKLLLEIKPVNFRELLKLDGDEKVTQRHYIYGVVKHLLEVAIAKKWNLCKIYDYTYVYNGAFWKQFNRDDIRKFLSNAAIRMGVMDYDAKHYEFSDKLLKQFLSEAHLPIPEKNKNKILINLRSGTFEFTEKGWEQRPFTPDDFLTYQLPFDYDVNAQSPIFDSYLKKVLPDTDSRIVLQEFSGFIFTNLNLEKCLVLTGSGSNGKSVFFNILNALVGKENTLNYSLGLFNEPYNRAQLTNVLLNYSSEKGFDLKPDIFKALISGEPIQACLKYGNPFTLKNNVKFIFNCNELPRETESTEAYFRRFIVIPFETIISENDRDIDLADKIIQDELPGVFNWLLDGLNRLVSQKKFTNSEKANEALQNFRKQSDSVHLFIEETYKKSDQNKITLAELYLFYKEFCRDDGYKPVGKNKFSQRLERLGFEKTRMNDGSSAFFIDRNVVHF